MQNSKLLAIGIITTIAIGLAFTPIADAVKAEALSKAAQTLNIVKNMQDNLLPALQEGVDTLFVADLVQTAILFAIFDGQHFQIVPMSLPYAFEVDVEDYEIMNVPEETEGFIEKVSCSLQQAAAWGEEQTVDLSIEVDGIEVCSITDAGSPSTLSNDDNFGELGTDPDLSLVGGEVVTMTCTTDGTEEGCAGIVIVWLKIGNDLVGTEALSERGR